MLCTVFYYTDSHVYEVVKVEKQNHIFIRRMKAIRVDNNGMSEMQKYKFESDFNRKIIELKFSYKHWKQVITDKFTNAKRLENINISFGIAKEYYDYSF